VYARSFSQCSINNPPLAIDSTPNYLSKPGVARSIWQTYPPSARPQLRFLVILRDPSERFRSWFDHFGASKRDYGDIGIDHFARLALRRTMACATRYSIDVTDSEALFNSKCRSPGPPIAASLSGGLYVTHLAEYLRVFDSAQFAIISFGGYIRRPKDVLEQLGTFLGIETDFVRRQLAAIDGPQAAPPAAHLSWFEVEDRAAAALPFHAGRRTMEASHANSHRKKHALSPRVRQLLDDFYAPSIRDLGHLLLEHSKRGMIVLPRGIMASNLTAGSSTQLMRSGVLSEL
jgi:hypothetical protein